eukprot:m.139150 g.139150  ORF g.139150 m.139150 type:complete len:209 (-) comp19334_c0_seq1:89-715(-)
MSFGPPPRRPGDTNSRSSSARKSRGMGINNSYTHSNNKVKDEDDGLSIVGSSSLDPHVSVLHKRKFKPVKFKSTYVDESLFGDDNTRDSGWEKIGVHSTKEPPPWEASSTRKAKSTTTPSRPSTTTQKDRLDWTKPSLEGHHRAQDPMKTRKTDPWGGPLTNTAPPSKGHKRPMPSDLGRGVEQLSLKKAVPGARSGATIDLAWGKRK